MAGATIAQRNVDLLDLGKCGPRKTRSLACLLGRVGRNMPTSLQAAFSLISIAPGNPNGA